ncbi:hypothetical protein N7467_007829 [Penicillium canescens]|nr:hypothetical protein N7467_007829 [Penicillium canescens]
MKPATTVKTMGSDCDSFLETFQRARELNLCPNRIWAVAGENIPKLLPDFNLIPRAGERFDEYGDYSEHNECTPDFCEYSQRDLTAVRQRHECKEAKCLQLRGRFSRVILERAARDGKLTAWNLAGDSMLESPQPYMAISHVWSDGTGTGAWNDGDVNECLYTFFQDIAKQFQYVGIWWDTLCIPREKAARSQAIQNIQNSYEHARVTLVHDCFLRNWRWDPETACFAILMSPWFSRGWTALELSKSRKVKIIFKGFGSPIIKDLDEEILAKDDEPDSPRKEASCIIKNLRRDITTLNDLLTLLSSRYTSWPKDIAIISALLVGVLPKERQQDTYQSILMKFGRISPGHLFHNVTTMSNGFSWCPANLFNMPLDSSDASLIVSRDGDIEGKWRVIPVEAELENNCWWDITHSLIRQEIQHALRSPRQCRLLAECGTGPVGRALLVREMQGTSFYQYVGAVHLRQELRQEEGAWIEKSVTVSSCRGNDKQMAFGRNCKTGDRSGAGHSNQDKEDLPNSASKAERFRCAIWRGDYHTFQELIKKTRLDASDQLGRRPLHLAAERGYKRMVEDLIRFKVNLNVRCNHGQTALHRAAWGGSAAVVELLQNRVDETAKDKDGNTALHIAAQMGFASVAKLLIKKSAIDIEGHKNLTPLHFAAMSGHSKVAELLKGANVEAKDNKIGWTPLHCASENGDQCLVKLLIERGAEVNVQDDRVGWTPLHFAAMRGHNVIVSLLLEKGAGITTKDKYGWTPQQFAEMNGHTEVLELLRGKGAGTLVANEDRWTPLHCKAINNQRGLAKLLADDDFEILINNKDKSWTPLQFAAEHELETTLRWLLDTGADIKAEYDRTPLHWAAEHGYKALTRLLLEKGANKEAKTPDGRTALHYAAARGHALVVQLLLAVGADKEAQAWNSCTPLYTAATGGHETVTRLLLEAGALRETKDRDDRTPLHNAAERGYEVVTRLLLENGADTEAKDLNGQTPLHDAAKSGHEIVARLLVKEGADKEARGWDGSTPLHRAAIGGHEAVTRLLLEVGADKEARARDGATPLHDAAERGHKVVTQLLLEKGVYTDITRWDGCTPLHRAAMGGYEAVTRLLLQAGANTEAIAYGYVRDGETPLHDAARSGHETVTRLLVKAGADKEARSRNGYTPLHMAAIGGHEAVTRLLLEEGAFRETKDLYNRTPLHYAAKHGHKVITQLLLEKGANKEA